MDRNRVVVLGTPLITQFRLFTLIENSKSDDGLFNIEKQDRNITKHIPTGMFDEKLEHVALLYFHDTSQRA